MREILFRGKRVGNGEWVYGLLVFVNKDTALTVEEAEQALKEREQE